MFKRTRGGDQKPSGNLTMFVNSTAIKKKSCSLEFVVRGRWRFVRVLTLVAAFKKTIKI